MSTIQPPNEILIPSRFRFAVRLGWILVAIFLLGVFIAGLGPRYRELLKICEAEDCFNLALDREEASILQDMGFSLQTYAAVQIGLEIYLILIFSLLAVFIFILRSDTWIGIIIPLAFVFICFVFFAEEPRTLARLAPYLQPFMDFLSSLSVLLFLLLFYLFPDGRFVPRWLAWVFGGLFGLLLLDSFVLQTEARAASATILVLVAFVVGATLGVFAQIYRYRKVSNLVQRQQTKWVVLGLISMFSMTMLWAVLIEFSVLDHGPLRLAFYFSLVIQYVLVGFFPISVVISILRYRLWDIDLIIRRTLQYALLTGLLSLVYFGGVALLQALLSAAGGAASPIVIVLTTLFIAALFNPLRRRLQDFIDRRFYRQKYDAEKALAQFAEAARSETDLERLSGTLVQTVQETVQPEAAQLWLANTKKEGEA